MYLLKKLCSITLILLLVMGTSVSHAQRKRSRAKKRDHGQYAIVIVDGSAIYQLPNFDAPVVEYLDRGKKVLISQKLYRGAGGLGAFYKIRLRPRVYAYITDVDVEIVGKVNPQAKTAEPAKREEVSPSVADPTQISEELMSEDVQEQGPAGQGIYYTRYTGLTFQNLNYAEVIANEKKTGAWGLIGFKMSGPGKLMGGMPLDIEVLVATGAPSFYDEMTRSQSGYAFVAHMMPMFPFVEKNKWVLYYSFGPMLRYSAFKVGLNVGGDDVDSQELAMGLNVGAGAAVRLGRKWALRVDSKFTYENESYTSFGAAIQYEY